MTIRDYVPVASDLRPSNIIDTQYGFIDLTLSFDNVVLNRGFHLVRFAYRPGIPLYIVHQMPAVYSLTYGQFIKNRSNLDCKTLLQRILAFAVTNRQFEDIPSIPAGQVFL